MGIFEGVRGRRSRLKPVSWVLINGSVFAEEVCSEDVMWWWVRRLGMMKKAKAAEVEY